MCDYSLHHALTRPAVVGDKLTTHSFGSTTGFRSSSDQSLAAAATAVCVLPGSEIAFSRPICVKAGGPFAALVRTAKKIVGIPPKAPNLVATFVQIDKDNPNKHHDALEFADDNIVLLNSLTQGQEATVLQLPAAPKTPAEVEEQRRAAYV